MLISSILAILHILTIRQDILVALGLVGDKKELGFEGSGIIRRVGSKVEGFAPGDRVITFHPGLFQSRIITTPTWCYKLPETLSMDQAATMPSVYATAIYTLIEVCSLRKGKVRSSFEAVDLAPIDLSR